MYACTGLAYITERGRKWNEDNGIKFLRMSSEMFPFASHNKYGYTLEYAEKELKVSRTCEALCPSCLVSCPDQAAGDLAKKYGHRLTSHPGQVRYFSSSV